MTIDAEDGHMHISSFSMKKIETLEPTGESALASMLSAPSLQNTVAKNRPLIAEVGGNKEVVHCDVPVNPVPVTASSSTNNNAVREDEGPSLLELMMQEQQQALKAKQQQDSKTQQQVASKSFGGFKKGFFGKSSTSTSHAKPTPLKGVPIDEVKVKHNAAAAKQESQKGMVFDEVQAALKEDNPMLDHLRSKQWVTPDLTAMLQQNPILNRGFQDPKCLAAVELMKKDPKAALTHFRNDADVSRFLQEFGKVMSAHFEKLSATQDPTTASVQPNETVQQKAIEEIGPLQAKALKKQRDQEKNTQANSLKSNGDAEQERVQQILNDPELRELLMDSDLQRILVECGDPVMLREHMKNSSTVRKIRKLQQAGLVQMQI